MNIKPFRDYSEHEVINLYAYANATGSKGTFVSPSVFNPSNYAGYTNIPVGAQYDGAFSNRFAVNARVAASASGTASCIGLLLYDVIENDENGIPIRFSPRYIKDAKCVVGSGEAVPILTRGIVEIGGFEGNPGPGSGGYIAANAGVLSVGLPSFTGSQKVGTFLSSTGADGFALFKVQL